MVMAYQLIYQKAGYKAKDHFDTRADCYSNLMACLICLFQDYLSFDKGLLEMITSCLCLEFDCRCFSQKVSYLTLLKEPKMDLSRVHLAQGLKQLDLDRNCYLEHCCQKIYLCFSFLFFTSYQCFLSFRESSKAHLRLHF